MFLVNVVLYSGWVKFILKGIVDINYEFILESWVGRYWVLGNIVWFIYFGSLNLVDVVEMEIICLIFEIVSEVDDYGIIDCGINLWIRLSIVDVDYWFFNFIWGCLDLGCCLVIGNSSCFDCCGER